ncbi:hypothetical protein [Coleofasciculus sp. FACHB-542]|uniref:hypothetical protein n=1 Tax=Coleofasciculus sp. FACHB-542 TaxID=2692787 RepID=UPI001688F3B7|nr:hypothetical protein [Coleofasciculus sp. FACHB-542]MBD2085427.1 hypothetical protein [Coleofasciculus sp. FACHB-542]
MMNKITLLGAVNQALVLQSGDRSLQTAPSGQVMLVSDRCYCIHQPETAIASLQRVLDKMRSLLLLLMMGDAIAFRQIPLLRFQPKLGKDGHKTPVLHPFHSL